jgi:polar amino acid transport system permease protein
MSYDWSFPALVQFKQAFLYGAFNTLTVAVGSIVLGLVIGLPAGLAKETNFAPLRWASTAYIELIRGTPALVQIVWLYYCLPILVGVQLGALTTLILALGIHSGAYVAEIFRAGINAIDKGQLAAAFAIGMSYPKALRRIILPQAAQKMIPPFINEFANLMKLTTLGSVIAFSELLHQSNAVIAQIYRPLEVYTALAIVFFVLTYPVIYLSRRLELRLRSGL